MAIIKFKCEWEAKLFIKSHALKLVGSGSEGTCYRGKDKKVYKCLNIDRRYPYDVDKIITEEDVKLDSFAFPDELYTVDDGLIGYRTDYVKGNYFSVDNTADIENIIDLDFEKLATAYKKMLEDIKLLSKEKILVYDLPFNVMFDGEKMTAIDTCAYKRVKKNPLEENITSLNKALEMVFTMWFMDYKDISYKIEGTNIKDYLDKIINALPQDLFMRRIIRMMEKDTEKQKVKQ